MLVVASLLVVFKFPVVFIYCFLLVVDWCVTVCLRVVFLLRGELCVCVIARLSLLRSWQHCFLSRRERY